MATSRTWLKSRQAPRSTTQKNRLVYRYQQELRELRAEDERLQQKLMEILSLTLE